MGNVLNAGYGLWIPTFTLDGSTKIFQMAMMFQNTGSATAAANNAAHRSIWAGVGKPFSAAMFAIGYTFARSECYVHIGALTTYDLNETAIVGTLGGVQGTPINTSLIIRKNTGLVGRRYQGRWMFPNMYITEGNISQAGTMAVATAAPLQTLLNTCLADQVTAGIPAVLGHSVSEIAPSPINSVTVGLKVGTMSRRIRGF